MKVLSDCNLVSSYTDGKWQHDSINCETLKADKDDIAARNAAVEATPPGSNGCIALPYFQGRGTPDWNANAYGGYLNDQFLTAAWNTRTDKYGGDVRGRATFLLEQIAAVRKCAGADVPVMVKFCPDHGVPYPGFRQLDEGIELAKYLEEQGVDALHVDAGCYEKWQLSMPALFYQEAVMQLKSAKAVKE